MTSPAETGTGAGRLAVPDGLSTAEVHAHTLASDGMVTSTELVQAAAAIGLHVLCVTDHDTMRGCDEAVAAGERYGVEVVRGQEITARMPPGTHLVGLFLRRPVRMGMQLEDAVDAVRDQGGVAIVAHPFMPTWFASATAGQLRRLLERRTVDGIELRHTAIIGPGGWRRLDEFYAEHRERLGAAVGAGDSHFGAGDLGRVVTVFPGRTAADLRRAIEQRTTSPLLGLAPEGPALRTRLAQQRRALLWLSGERRAGRVGTGVAPRFRRG